MSTDSKNDNPRKKKNIYHWYHLQLMLDVPPASNAGETFSLFVFLIFWFSFNLQTLFPEKRNPEENERYNKILSKGKKISETDTPSTGKKSKGDLYLSGIPTQEYKDGILNTCFEKNGDKYSGLVVQCVEETELQGGLNIDTVKTEEWKEVGLEVKHCPMHDYGLGQTNNEGIKEAVKAIDTAINEGKSVLVHCKAGKGRSWIVLMCYLTTCGEMEYIDAKAYVKSQRPQVSPNEKQECDVLRYMAWASWANEPDTKVNTSNHVNDHLKNAECWHDDGKQKTWERGRQKQIEEAFDAFYTLNLFSSSESKETSASPTNSN